MICTTGLKWAQVLLILIKGKGDSGGMLSNMRPRATWRPRGDDVYDMYGKGGLKAPEEAKNIDERPQERERKARRLD